MENPGRRGMDQLRGRGGGGARIWIDVRLNSAALIFFFGWFFVSLLRLPDLSYGSVRPWLAAPMNSLLMILLIAMTFWHIRQGLKEVADDYVHTAGAKLAAEFAIAAFAIGGAGFGIWSVARIALSGE